MACGKAALAKALKAIVHSSSIGKNTSTQIVVIAAVVVVGCNGFGLGSAGGSKGCGSNNHMNSCCCASHEEKL